MKLRLLFVAFTLAFMGVACEKPDNTTFEDAGKRMDQGIHDAGENTGKGLNKAGEKVKEVTR